MKENVLNIQSFLLAERYRQSIMQVERMKEEPTGGPNNADEEEKVIAPPDTLQRN